MSKPPVTYGRARPQSSSTSLIFDLTPPTSPLITPHPSSDDMNIPSINISSGKENISPQKIKQIPTQATLGDFFNLPTKKRPLQSTSSSDIKVKKVKLKERENGFRQMHLTHLPLLHTCPQCLMSYVRGGDDEATHEKHHARVTRGIIWDGLGRGKKIKKVGSVDVLDKGWRVIKENVIFGGKGKGRIIIVDGSYGGSKLDDILNTIDTVLSSPPLPPVILDQCKIFLFTTTSPPPGRLQPTRGAPKERIVSVVVAQPIKWAMKVLSPQEKGEGGRVIDSGEGVLCDSTPLPTPLGIHRIFTIPPYRSLGLSKLLLDASCENTIPGTSWDPRKGQVAFSQPTNSGRITMEKWGKGQVRVFVDDESQL